MGKRGQIQISFGMIFSIILTIFIIATAIYAITFFLNLSKCSQIGLFFNDLEKRVDKAWTSEISQEVFSGSLPGGIVAICFGNLNQSFIGHQIEHEDISDGLPFNTDNSFIYPVGEACGREGASFNLVHAKSDNFFCSPVVGGEVEVRLVKGQFDSLVRLESKE